jgi:two-component system, LytTR family, sensor kinase
LKSLIRQYPGEAESYTMKLSEFLRYTMQAHNSNLVPLRQELKFTQDYLELQKMRFENSLRIGLDIPQEALDWLLPAYALQTLVENAIKHNAFTDKKPLHISISCAQDRISVCNNKLLSKAEGSPGMGLKNLNDRYRLIADKEIIIADQNHQFCVTVPLIPNESL